MLGYYLFVLLELSLSETVRFSEQIMASDKYPSIYPRQSETVVFNIFQVFSATGAVLKIGNITRIFHGFSWGIFSHVTRRAHSANESV